MTPNPTNSTEFEANQAFFKENGYLHVKNVFSEAEIQACLQEYETLFERKSKVNNLQAKWQVGEMEKLDPNENKSVVLSIHNLQCHSAIFTKMLLNDKLLDATSAAVGSPNVILHHTKAHVKPPEVGAPYPTHQDYPYFPYRDHSMVAAFINLDDSSPENGGLVIFPGSHKLGPLPDCSDNPNFHHVNQEEWPLSKGFDVHAKRGDVIIFSYLMVHGSYPNTSTRDRRMLLVQMASAEDDPTTDLHASPCRGLVLRGSNVKMDAEFSRIFKEARNVRSS